MPPLPIYATLPRHVLELRRHGEGAEGGKAAATSAAAGWLARSSFLLCHLERLARGSSGEGGTRSEWLACRRAGPSLRTRLVDQCSAQTQINTCLVETPPYPKAHAAPRARPVPPFDPPNPQNLPRQQPTLPGRLVQQTAPLARVSRVSSPRRSNSPGPLV